jgi:hypothetical protein
MIDHSKVEEAAVVHFVAEAKAEVGAVARNT